MSLQTFFVILFVGYIVAILFVGVRASSRVSGSADYSVAGRRLRLPLATMTFTATYVSALTVIGMVGGASSFGLALVTYIFVGVGLGLLVATCFARRIHEWGVDAQSLPEVLGNRYRNDLIRVGSAAIIVIAYFVYLVAQLFAVGILLATVMNLPVWAVVLVVGSVFVAYTLMGGLVAVARTDAYQMVMLLAGVLLTFGLVVYRIGSTADLSWSDAPGLSGLLGGPVPTWAIAGGWILSWGLGLACQPNYIQRILACPDGRTARSMIGLGSTVIIWLTSLPVLVIGLGIAVIRPGLEGDSALPTFLMSDAGAVIGSLALLGLLSAVMSTTDSLLHVLGVYTARDVLGPLLGVTGEAHGLRLSRRITGILGSLAVLVATYMSFSPLPLVLEFASYAVALLAAGLFVPLYGGMVWKRATHQAALLSMIGGVLVGSVSETLRATGTIAIHGIVPATLVAIVVFVTVGAVTGGSDSGTPEPMAEERSVPVNGGARRA